MMRKNPIRTERVEKDSKLGSKIELRKPVRTSKPEDRLIHVYTVCFRNIHVYEIFEINVFFRKINGKT